MGSVNNLAKLFRRVSDIDHARDGADFVQRKETHQRLGHGRQSQADDVATPYAMSSEGQGCGIDLFQQLLESRLLSEITQSHFIGKPFRSLPVGFVQSRSGFFHIGAVFFDNEVAKIQKLHKNLEKSVFRWKKQTSGVIKRKSRIFARTIFPKSKNHDDRKLSQSEKKAL
jgi:hypothetical protein